MEHSDFAGFSYEVYPFGSGGPVILWGTFGGEEQEALLARLAESRGEASFVLVPFRVPDWNRYFSPWPAQQVRGDEAFAGEGEVTLSWLTEEVLPALFRRFGEDVPVYLAGYSLAGLFALWGGYERDCFAGLCSCSGSLWYPGFREYAGERTLPRRCRVFLSLGSKEEKTRNPVMAAVGDATREQERLLAEDKNTEAVTLAWNPGGHFNDPVGRLARGLLWLLRGES